MFEGTSLARKSLVFVGLMRTTVASAKSRATHCGGGDEGEMKDVAIKKPVHRLLLFRSLLSSPGAAATKSPVRQPLILLFFLFVKKNSRNGAIDVCLWKLTILVYEVVHRHVMIYDGRQKIIMMPRVGWIVLTTHLAFSDSASTNFIGPEHKTTRLNLASDLNQSQTAISSHVAFQQLQFNDVVAYNKLVYWDSWTTCSKNNFRYSNARKFQNT